MRAVTEHETMLEAVLKAAKMNLVNNDCLVPVALAFQGQEHVAILQMAWSSPEEKENMYYSVGAFCRDKNLDRVVFVADAAMREIHEDNVENGLPKDGQRPLALPEGHPDRVECLVLTFVLFTDKMENYTLIQKYRKENGSLIYGDKNVHGPGDEIVLNSLIVSMSRAGYNGS